MHSENGDRKDNKDSDRAVDHQRGSAAYGSEIEYTQVKTKQELGLEDEEEMEEEFEEEYEEESEESVNHDSKNDPRSATNEGEKAGFLGKEHNYGQTGRNSEIDYPLEVHRTENLSRKTSFSDFYVIDKEEEHRLKQIAFERYLADK